MKYRPYQWMGDDQDAHVQDWRHLEAVMKGQIAFVETQMGYMGYVQMLGSNIICGRPERTKWWNEVLGGVVHLRLW